MKKTVGRVACVLVILSVFVCSFANTAWAQTEARGEGEAPGGTPLAPLPASNPTASRQQNSLGPAQPVTPSQERSLSFGEGSGECRDTVPGGKLLPMAYAIVVLMIGAYVFVLVRKNDKLAARLEELETQMLRHTGKNDQNDPVD